MSTEFETTKENEVVIIKVIEDKCVGLWKATSELIDKEETCFVFDFSEVTFLNSMNIAAIISLRNKTIKADCKFAMGGLKENIKSVFKILKLDKLFNLDASIEEAVESIK